MSKYHLAARNIAFERTEQHFKRCELKKLGLKFSLMFLSGFDFVLKKVK